ncbi:DUF4954 domain-containing protein [Spirochaetia bacterium]|nr:DUF4954 domain-containing protein [Spirochaetia bacterium]
MSLIFSSEFSGTVYIGQLAPQKKIHHDLCLDVGIYNSYIEDCVIGDNVCVRNVHYLKNYIIEDSVILFNIDEMSCTNHSKFGNGILKEGEPESNRIWIGVANENEGRAVLPVENMLPSDAWIWSSYRSNKPLMQRFLELTEYGNDKICDTVGLVSHNAVIKNTLLIKDVKVGCYAYIKGALKLKNITICSSADEVSQIGEGVEMVNGIMGYGSKVFYQAIAVRFVIGRNCQLKYGARLLNSVLGDNSTVSCCELLNNLIYPFHEQHHNTSFLIAATIQGQSNIAAGATVGSNHNSRSSDGEIFAGRGFWTGLCSNFRHNSRFASFTLATKGTYANELNIIYPFSLISVTRQSQNLIIIPAYWFMYNMFAIIRNKSKFTARDKRFIKAQHIEKDPFAPDTMHEIIVALKRIIELTALSLGNGTSYQAAKDYLHRNPGADLTLDDPSCQRKGKTRLLKVVRAYKEYRKVVKYFAVKTLLEYGKSDDQCVPRLSHDFFADIEKLPLYNEWENAGGQVIPSLLVAELCDDVVSGKIKTWDDVHSFYDRCYKSYPQHKARYALYLLEQLYSCKAAEFTPKIFNGIKEDVYAVSNYIYESAVKSRQKDFSDPFRAITYRNKDEMEAVLGTINDSTFLLELERDTATFNKLLDAAFS